MKAKPPIPPSRMGLGEPRTEQVSLDADAGRGRSCRERQPPRGLLAWLHAGWRVASARLLTPRSRFRAVMASPQTRTIGTT
jgi:hypothetical protein